MYHFNDHFQGETGLASCSQWQNRQINSSTAYGTWSQNRQKTLHTLAIYLHPAPCVHNTYVKSDQDIGINMKLSLPNGTGCRIETCFVQKPCRQRSHNE